MSYLCEKYCQNCVYATTSIKGYNQGEAVRLPNRLQWVNISVPSVNDSLQDQTV